MSRADDMEAIDRYIKGTPLKTAAARDVYNEWTIWFDNISLYYSQGNYDHARNLRNRFNLANAQTTAEQARAKEVMATGMTTEEMAGGTRRTLADGSYAEPLISPSTQFLIGVGLALAAVGFVALKIGELEIKPLTKLLKS
jgi:hypothetical protein